MPHPIPRPPASRIRLQPPYCLDHPPTHPTSTFGLTRTQLRRASHEVRRKKSAHASEERDLRKELVEAATSSAVSDTQPATQQPSVNGKYEVQCVLSVCRKKGWREKPKKGKG